MFKKTFALLVALIMANTASAAFDPVVLVGDSAVNQTVDFGGVQDVFGTVELTTVLGTQNMKAGSALLGIENFVLENGVQNVEVGADIGDKDNYMTIGRTEINPDGTPKHEGTQNVYGTAHNTIVNSGVQSVKAGGTALSTTVNGKAHKVGQNTFYTYGTQDVYGTIGGETKINENAFQHLYSGAVIRNQLGDKVKIYGGTQYVYGDIDADTASRIEMYYGIQNIEATGSVTGMKLSGYAGASRHSIQNVYGRAADTVVNNGGLQIIWDGATIAGANNRINSGGVILFNSNDFTSNAAMLKFNGGNIKSAIRDLTVGSDTAISGNGTIHISLRSSSHGADSDFFTFGDISGEWLVNLMYTKADMDALNNLDSIDIIQNNSADLTAAKFTALNGGIDLGLYHWDLAQDSGGLVSAVRSDSVSNFVYNITNHAYSIKSVIGKLSNSMYKRVGELQWLESGVFGPVQGNGLWARGIYKSSTSDNVSNAQVSVGGIEFGYDARLANDKTNNFFVGVMGYFADGSAEFSTAASINDTSDLTSYGAGLYAIWLNKAGWFFDAVARVHFISQDVTAFNTGATGTIAFDTEHTAATLNLDFGREFAFNTDRIGLGWFLTPHAEFSAAYIGGDTFETSTGIGGEIEASTSMSAAVELLGGPRWKLQNGGKLQLYGKVGYTNEFSNNLDVRIGGMDMTAGFSGGSILAGAGLDYKSWTGQTSMYLDGTYQSGDEFSEYSGIIGMRIQF